MQPKDDKPASETTPKSPDTRGHRHYESTLPFGRKDPSPSPDGAPPEGELDLDLGDIQSRLPYGSEDIADK